MFLCYVNKISNFECENTFIHKTILLCLQENADIDKVCGILQKVPFGQGFLSVDIKKAREENSEAQAKDIDPYTLYVGNLPTNVTKSSVIQHFPGVL